jgi:hypothetical protein
MADCDDDDGFVIQGTLEPGEAERLLPRLEKDGVRFEIDAGDITVVATRGGPRRSSQITLFVHREDVDAWYKIRSELYPV